MTRSGLPSQEQRRTDCTSVKSIKQRLWDFHSEFGGSVGKLDIGKACIGNQRFRNVSIY